MGLAGGISAVLNAGAFVAVLSLHPLFVESATVRMATAALAVVAFVGFARFHLLASARQLTWMLGRGARRWLHLPVAMAILLLFCTRGGGKPVGLLLVHWSVLALPLQLASLVLLRGFAHSINNAPGNQRNAVFFGLGNEARKLNLRLGRSPILGIRVVGYYSDVRIEPAPGETLPPWLGRYEDASARIQSNDFEVVFIATGHLEGERITTELVSRLYDSTAAIYFVPESRFAEDLAANSTDLAGVPLLALHDMPIVGLSRVLKRVMDIVGAALLLLVLWPVMLAIAIAIRLDSPGPVLFRQLRYGERGEPIIVHKFRSMYFRGHGDGGTEQGGLRQATNGDRRITPVGRYLRRSSLDELPQLIDVLRGAMSLVGPRPHAAEHNELYRRLIPGYMLRHSVKPGITGWAQIHGLRGATDTPDKMQRRVEYDRYYITHWSLWLDLRILLRTLPEIVAGRNAL